MAQTPEGKDERPLQTHSFKDFLAVNTTNSRVACPPNCFYDLENAQPIGAANVHSINDVSAALANFGADTAYYDCSVYINGTEYLIVATASGKLYAYAIAAQTLTQINGAITLSGNSTRMTQWNITTLLIIDSTGYYSWIGSGNITAISGSGAPTSGSGIAVYSNIVWISQGRLLYFSAVGSSTDFTSADGGGTTALTDPSIRSSITALLAANGYLYIFGTAGVSCISDVYVPSGASPPTPSFTLLNLSAILGTDQPYSIQLYGRLVLFANRYGVWSIYGTAITSISSPDPNNTYNSSIDGTWQYVNFSQAVSGGQVVSNNLLCASFLIKRNSDPVFGSNTVIALYQGNAAGGKWWFGNYGTTGALTRITTGFVNSIPALFGYIGNKLYQLFALTTSAPPATVMTGFWDFKDPVTQKEVIRAGVQFAFAAGGNGVTLTVDTPQGSQEVQVVATVGAVTWINANGAIVTWQNNALNTVVWVPSGQVFTYWGGGALGASKYIGMTCTTTQGMLFELDCFMLDYKLGQRWNGN